MLRNKMGNLQDITCSLLRVVYLLLEMLRVRDYNSEGFALRICLKYRQKVLYKCIKNEQNNFYHFYHFLPFYGKW